MKKIILSMVGVATLFSACTNVHEILSYQPADVEVNAVYLENVRGEIPLDMTITLSEQYSDKHTGIEIRPILVNEATGDSAFFTPMVIEGKTHDMFNSRLNVYDKPLDDDITARESYIVESATTIPYFSKIKFENWMSGATLYADLYANAYTDEILLQKLVLGQGVVDYPQYIVFNPCEKLYYYSQLDKDVTIAKSIPFEVAKAEIDPIYMGETFVDSYNKVLNDPLLKDYVVEVLIANSPEGTYELNKKLNFDRRVAVTKYLEEIGVPLEKCDFDVRVEDWDQLANLIAASDLKNAAKMAEMVKGYDGGDSDSFEQKFSATFLSEYSSVRRELYPELRRAFIKIIPEYEEDVAVNCHYCIASDISNPDSEAMESRLFTKYQVLDILNLNNNLVNAYGAADYKKAAAYADQIPYDYANEFVRSNKALAYLRVGRYAEARAILERNTIEDVQYNYALACLLEGDYETANKAFEGYVDTNVAVAKMALGQYPQAESVLIILLDGTKNKKELLEIIGSK